MRFVVIGKKLDLDTNNPFSVLLVETGSRLRTIGYHLGLVGGIHVVETRKDYSLERVADHFPKHSVFHWNDDYNKLLKSWV